MVQLLLMPMLVSDPTRYFHNGMRAHALSSGCSFSKICAGQPFFFSPSFLNLICIPSSTFLSPQSITIFFAPHLSPPRAFFNLCRISLCISVSPSTSVSLHLSPPSPFLSPSLPLPLYLNLSLSLLRPLPLSLSSLSRLLPLSPSSLSFSPLLSPPSLSASSTD